MENKTYLAIDLKSFYASVECMERGLDPMTTNLVVADQSRTEKTICLAVSPSLKTFGIPGRPRLFEVVQKIKNVNAERQRKAPGRKFTGSSYHFAELQSHPELAVDYIVAPPQMAKYMEISTQIYNVYLKHIAPEDIHVYSIDEVFMDVTHYLKTYGLTARELAMRIILDVLKTTGITATAGIGTNLYLCKVAMDIEAKHIPPDENGVRIAELDEMSYRRKLWSHRPLEIHPVPVAVVQVGIACTLIRTDGVWFYHFSGLQQAGAQFCSGRKCFFQHSNLSIAPNPLQIFTHFGVLLHVFEKLHNLIWRQIYTGAIVFDDSVLYGVWKGNRGHLIP